MPCLQCNRKVLSSLLLCMTVPSNAQFLHPQYNCTVLYLNVCGWTRVPQPKSTTDPVPVKGGVLRHKLDKVTNKKINELIYDVAFNPEVLAEVSSSDELEKMLTQLCFTYIEDVVGITVKDKKSYTKVRNEGRYSLDMVKGEIAMFTGCRLTSLIIFNDPKIISK